MPNEQEDSHDSIFAFDGEDYMPFLKNQPDTISSAFMQLLENIGFLLEDAYGINDQYCIVVPAKGCKGFYDDFETTIFFENHDCGYAVSTDDESIADREDAAETLSKFLYHLRLTAASIGYDDDILIEKQSGTRFALAFGDPRKLIYALATLAAQNGISDELSPVTRHGRSPEKLGLTSKFGAHVIGDIGPFLKTAPNDPDALPTMPNSLKGLLEVLSEGMEPLDAPELTASPLADSIPRMH